MYSTVQNAVYNVDYGHLKYLDLARSPKRFRLRGPGPGIQVIGLAIDQTGQLYFFLETDFMPAFQLIMHSHKDVSLMQFQANACLFYNIAK